MRRSAFSRRFAFSSVVALVGLLAAGACTQDFDQFEPILLSGSSGAGGAGSGAAPTTTGGDGGENCANGKDDDGDGAIDCADESCGGFSCVAVPNGWRGPGLLYKGPASAEIACPASFPERVDVGGRGVEAPATCSPCSCGEPASACGAVELTGYRDDACRRQSTAVPVQAGQCLSLNLPFDSYRAAPPKAASCEASGGMPTGPAPRFKEEGLVCTRPPGEDGCGQGQACAPREREIDGPFQRGLCVYREGERRCPQGFDERHVFARGMIDRRGCTRCMCDASGVTCTATTTLFRDDDCRESVATVSHDGRCLEDAPSAAALRVQVTGTGSCQPRGGMPTGEVVESDEKITVCCAR